MEMNLHTVPGVPGSALVEVSSLPEALDGAVSVGQYSAAKPGALLAVVPGVGRFLALRGERIEFWREPGSDPVSVEQFLYGGVRAALIDQRGGLPLHAACLVSPGSGEAMAVAGQRGAGKSTMTAELVRRGWLLLGDDLTAVYLQEGALMAWPSRGGIRLWRDACDRMDVRTETLVRIPGEREKYIVPAASTTQPAPLTQICVLDRSRAGGLEAISGPRRLATLLEQTYRPRYLKGLGCVENHLALSCQIAEHVTMQTLCYTGPVTDGADLLEATVR